MALRFRYMTYEFGQHDIHLRALRDKQEYSDHDGAAKAVGISPANWSLFGVVWPSAVVLANNMFAYDFENLRILEIGCGIGLTSLLLNHLKADISAMDYHPEVKGLLKANAALNGDPEIPFMRLDWTEAGVGLGSFDLIIGSDLLYVEHHIPSLADYFAAHCRANGQVIIVEPNRGQKGFFNRQMSNAGFRHTAVKAPEKERHIGSFKGTILTYQRNM